MTDGNFDGVIDVLIKRKSTKNHGFEIERREEDGFYYITKVPRNCTEIGVGDRVLEINGTIFEDFQDETDANDLIDCTLLEVYVACNETTKRHGCRDQIELSSQQAVSSHIIFALSIVAVSQLMVLTTEQTMMKRNTK
jgi:hypothetical protein